MWTGPTYRYLRDLVTVPLICWLSSALKKLQQKEISHLHSRSLLEMTATNTVSSVYQTNVVLMLEKIRLNAVQPKCTCKKWRKNLLCRKNTQATARGKSAVFLRFNRKKCETQEVKNLGVRGPGEKPSWGKKRSSGTGGSHPGQES